jgi:hypothetical protein
MLIVKATNVQTTGQIEIRRIQISRIAEEFSFDEVLKTNSQLSLMLSRIFSTTISTPDNFILKFVDDGLYY